mmetsp:Transcript_42039/g.94526  ORF Transcript_42039/g.94526 Transcript_42039/m.94526 type:complete len:169 (-) Transcript_42039:110-616(-)
MDSDIQSASIKAAWLTYGLLAAPLSLVSAPVMTVVDGAPNSFTHWFVVIQASEGWYSVEKERTGECLLRGPFATQRLAEVACCFGLGAEPSRKSVWMKREAAQVAESMRGVKSFVTSFSKEYNVLHWDTNCKGFADQLLDFIEGRRSKDRGAQSLSCWSGFTFWKDHR